MGKIRTIFLQILKARITFKKGVDVFLNAKIIHALHNIHKHRAQKTFIYSSDLKELYLFTAKFLSSHYCNHPAALSTKLALDSSESNSLTTDL